MLRFPPMLTFPVTFRSSVMFNDFKTTSVLFCTAIPNFVASVLFKSLIDELNVLFSLLIVSFKVVILPRIPASLKAPAPEASVQKSVSGNPTIFEHKIFCIKVPLPKNSPADMFADEFMFPVNELIFVNPPYVTVPVKFPPVFLM